jgi:hypothetical protein
LLNQVKIKTPNKLLKQNINPFFFSVFSTNSISRHTLPIRTKDELGLRLQAFTCTKCREEIVVSPEIMRQV